MTDYRCFIGLDPAKTNDYCAVAVRFTPTTPNEFGEYIPLFKDVYQVQDESYVTIINDLQKGILSKYGHFTTMHVDYTTEKAVADFLIAKYGKDRVIKRVFTTGEAGSKMQLMKIGRITYANPRHTWPRVNDIKDPTKKELVTSLLKQIVSEGFEMGSNNNITFDHTGAHNDLLHADLLALEASQQWVLKQQMVGGDHVGGPPLGQPDIYGTSKTPAQHDVERILRGY